MNMTRKEAIGRIQEHIHIHSKKEPFTPYLDKAFDMAIEALKDRPHGEWKFVQRGKFVDMVCPICGFVREDGIAYNMTVEEVLDSVDADTFSIHGKSDFPKYCEECGAKMCNVMGLKEGGEK